MSHIERAKTGIVKADPTLVKQSVKLMENLFGYNQTDGFTNYIGRNKTKAEICIKHPQLARHGVAIHVKNGQIEIEGDISMSNRQKLLQHIKQCYQAQATQNAFGRMGYRSQSRVEEKNGQQLVLVNAVG